MSQIICRDMHLKCFKRRRAQELTDANCAAKLLLQKFLQYATDFVLCADKKVFSVTSNVLMSAEQSQWQTAGTSEEEA